MSDQLAIRHHVSATARDAASEATDSYPGAALLNRLDRLPVTSPVLRARAIVGMATFFDGYTTLSIAYAVPILHQTWHLTSQSTAGIISAGYVGQLIGALVFGWLAERAGRLPVLVTTITIFAIMSLACIFSWDASSMMLFRFLQGIGTGGEVPVASAYVNELSTSKNRGRFFLLYELLFLVGLAFAGMIGYALVPVIGWQAMFIVGTVPLLLIVPLSFTLSESPRWLIDHGQFAKAKEIIETLEKYATRKGGELPPPRPTTTPLITQKPSGSLKELFSPVYARRTLLLWVLWFGSYMVNNGLVTWLPTLYQTFFGITVKHAIGLGFAMTTISTLGALICALSIDKVGRRRWYTGALALGGASLITLYVAGVSSLPVVFALTTLSYACIQTITYSLYLYSAELYPTRLRSTGAGFGSAWLRAGSIAGPLTIGTLVSNGSDGSIALVFGLFGVTAVITAGAVYLFGPETSGKSLENLSP
ncbi:MFS transporter [Acetobacter sacchari]|uniref:MFS transporter n=1 Tax=Acetobacter sacchari TaxID=2661687 RepID=A0ABS3LWF3_9PROT|nr:MFS transporter [Acetobacter sacchari]MBO1360231.1 MFS transporter [Acetobacter sacchari]